MTDRMGDRPIFLSAILMTIKRTHLIMMVITDTAKTFRINRP